MMAILISEKQPKLFKLKKYSRNDSHTASFNGSSSILITRIIFALKNLMDFFTKSLEVLTHPC